MIGVDRLDYTKGIPERFLALERLLEPRSEWIGQVTFLQVARRRARASRSTTRSSNGAGTGPADQRTVRAGGLPADHAWSSITSSSRCSALPCRRRLLVTSLHDGMNLVAKEFVAARDDEAGVLVLSQFAGASRELHEALIVNPYDTDQCAAALDLALSMPKSEQRERMRACAPSCGVQRLSLGRPDARRRWRSGHAARSSERIRVVSDPDRGPSWRCTVEAEDSMWPEVDDNARPLFDCNASGKAIGIEITTPGAQPRSEGGDGAGACEAPAAPTVEYDAGMPWSRSLKTRCKHA